MSATVLITGATGFVGRQVLRTLVSRGVAVRAVVREGTQARLESAPPEEVITTPDLFAQDAAWWSRACRGIDTVIHVAWYVEPGRYLQSPKNLDCLSGTLELARGAASAGVRRVVGLGTCFEYELTGSTLTTTTPLRPLTAYAASKAAAFLALSQWLPLAGTEFAWCRLFYLYGEGEDSRRLVPTIRERLARGEPAELTRGDQVRDFLDVAEAGRLITDAALGVVQGPVNICSGVPITVRALAERVAQDYGRPDLLRFGARPENLLDPPCVVGVPWRRSPAHEQR